MSETTEPVAWDLYNVDGRFDLTDSLSMAREWEKTPGNVAHPLYRHPAPRGRVVVLDDKWRIVDGSGLVFDYDYASKDEASSDAREYDRVSPECAPHRVMRLALVDADAKPPRGRVVVTEAMKRAAADALAVKATGRGLSTFGKGMQQVFLSDAETVLTAALALVDADAPEVDRG